MAEQKSQQQAGWRDKRREKKRVKRERTGDSPEKRSEHQKPTHGADDDVAGAMWKTGTTGFLGGGF